MQPGKAHRQLIKARLLATLLCCLFISTAIGGVLPAAVNGQPLPTLAPILEKVTPAVVNISTLSRTRIIDDPLFNFLFNLPQQEESPRPQSLGSGVIVDAQKGHVLTNYHVIENASKIIINLSDGREAVAEVLGVDPRADVALLKIELDGLVEVELADSDALRVGDFCIAIGNPFGLGQTVTSGIVSALSRSGLGIEDFEDFIQTDASINPGNSGGALIDLNGKLIGINTAIVGPSGGNVGIGFAIPSNMAREIADQLLRFGEVRRGELGISAQDLTPDLARAFAVNSRYGVVVSRIRKGSPAEKAGVQVGDVITAVDGKPAKDVRSIKNTIGLVMLGQQLELTVIREGKTINIAAKIEELDRAIALFDGVVLAEETTRSGRQYLVIESVEPGSVIDRNGLQAGDIVLSVNRQYVSTIDGLEQQALGAKGPLLLLIQRGQRRSYVEIQ